MAEAVDSIEVERRRAKDRARKNTDTARAKRRARYAANTEFRQRSQEKCRAYYANNASKLAAAKRNERSAEPERAREYNRLRYAKHQAKNQTNSRDYYWQNRVKVLEKHRAKREAERAAKPPKEKLTQQQYMRRWQEGIAGRSKPTMCEACGAEGRIVFDHCHRTSKFRGWICQHCNIALGAARDDPKVLRKLIEYLAHV